MADSAAPSVGRVFISYRREESAYAAGWLFDRLVDRFGRGQIFKDIDSIQLGDDFVEVITTAVGSCDVLLALIGEQWLTITDEHGTARLNNPDDFLRLELEAALTRDVRVIPILVEGARMPRAEQLPPSLAKLVRRQALELSPSHFESDTSRLLSVISSTLAGAATRARREAEEQARREAEEQARREAEERARREAEERARREAEERARRDAEEQARRDAEEQARREAEEHARRVRRTWAENERLTRDGTIPVKAPTTIGPPPSGTPSQQRLPKRLMPKTSRARMILAGFIALLIAASVATAVLIAGNSSSVDLSHRRDLALHKPAKASNQYQLAGWRTDNLTDGQLTSTVKKTGLQRG
jgi:TIR domain